MVMPLSTPASGPLGEATVRGAVMETCLPPQIWAGTFRDFFPQATLGDELLLNSTRHSKRHSPSTQARQPVKRQSAGRLSTLPI